MLWTHRDPSTLIPYLWINIELSVHTKKFAKIEAEHEALTRQQKSQEAFLNQLAQDKFQLWQLIKKKTHERNSRREMMAHNLAKELVKCPKDILNHLEQEIATSITTDTHPNNTY